LGVPYHPSFAASHVCSLESAEEIAKGTSLAARRREEVRRRRAAERRERLRRRIGHLRGRK
jgi:hypothetical protein